MSRRSLRAFALRRPASYTQRRPDAPGANWYRCEGSVTGGDDHLIRARTTAAFTGSRPSSRGRVFKSVSRPRGPPADPAYCTAATIAVAS